jgi:hypothetical protein
MVLHPQIVHVLHGLFEHLQLAAETIDLKVEFELTAVVIVPFLVEDCETLLLVNISLV